MYIRVIHIEVTSSLVTDSFILAQWRLVAQQGNIRSIYSDNGSNFNGAKEGALGAKDLLSISRIILGINTILGSILKTHGECLDDKSC